MSDLPKLIALPVAIGITIFNWPASHSSQTKPPAEVMARVLSGVFPKQISAGMTLQAPRVEGDVLILETTLSAAALGSFNEAEISRLMLNSVCVGADGLTRYFKDGGRLRMDVRQGGGQVYRGPVLASCPIA